MRKDMKDMVNEIRNDEIEIFGEHKTREEIIAAEKARKAKERKAIREVAKARRTAVEGGTEVSRRDLFTVIVVIFIIMALGIGALAIQFSGVSKNEKFDRDESRTYFFNDSAVPEDSDEGVQTALTCAYYTKGGYLCVQVLLGNSTDYDMQVETLDIVLYNATETIASAKIENPTKSDSDEPFVVPSGEHKNYEFYIKPEHVFLKDDSLNEVGFTSTVEATVLETE